jgi:hypothetical protein
MAVPLQSQRQFAPYDPSSIAPSGPRCGLKKERREWERRDGR